MIQNKKCAGNAMTKDGKTFQYVEPPQGDGQWYSTIEQTVVNCITQELTFTMESDNGPIEAPLGPLTVDPNALTTLLNHNRIVWQMPKSFKEKTCTLQEFIKATVMLPLRKNKEN